MQKRYPGRVQAIKIKTITKYNSHLQKKQKVGYAVLKAFIYFGL